MLTSTFVRLRYEDLVGWVMPFELLPIEQPFDGDDVAIKKPKNSLPS